MPPPQGIQYIFERKYIFVEFIFAHNSLPASWLIDVLRFLEGNEKKFWDHALIHSIISLRKVF